MSGDGKVTPKQSGNRSTSDVTGYHEYSKLNPLVRRAAVKQILDRSLFPETARKRSTFSRPLPLIISMVSVEKRHRFREMPTFSYSLLCFCLNLVYAEDRTQSTEHQFRHFKISAILCSLVEVASNGKMRRPGTLCLYGILLHVKTVAVPVPLCRDHIDTFSFYFGLSRTTFSAPYWGTGCRRRL